MPRGNRRGPWGLGPMTGRAAGYCADYPVPGYLNPIPRFGRGYGFGRGWGRRRGRGFGRSSGWYPPHHPYVYPPTRQYAYPPPVPKQSPEQEVEALENYKKELEAERADLEKEMNVIETRIKDSKAKLEQEKSSN